ncbi:MAG TPA: toprim domain-containing protein [Candidatus Paceibacterota bacterium]
MSVRDELLEIFKGLPGVGPRQAERFIFSLMKMSGDEINRFARLITEVRGNMRVCKHSFQIYFDQFDATGLSPIERNPLRSAETLMIVEKDSDLKAVEESAVYNGKYFVLGNLEPLIERKKKFYSRIPELIERIKVLDSDNTLKEIIFALSPSLEGDMTMNKIKNTIEDQIPFYTFKVSTLGRGISTGSELEYLDRSTISSALEGRK